MCIVHIQEQETTKLSVSTFQSPFHLDVHQEQRNHWLLQRMHGRARGVYVCAGGVCVNTVPKGPNTDSTEVPYSYAAFCQSHKIHTSKFQ